MSETESRADVKRPYGKEHAKISGQSIREQREQEVMALSADLIVEICLESNCRKEEDVTWDRKFGEEGRGQGSSGLR